MSEENVEVVRFAYEEGLAKRTTDHPGTRERVTDDFRFHARRERELGEVATVRAGKITRVRLYGSWTKALEAAGLSEELKNTRLETRSGKPDAPPLIVGAPLCAALSRLRN